MANRYDNALIYRMVGVEGGNEYIGSTCSTLAKRKGGHKSTAKRHPTRKVYAYFNEIGWANVVIILIEKFPCADKMELEKRERYWIEERKSALNSNIPTRPKKCEHDRERYTCKDCGGSSICEHNRRRSACKDCGGGSICGHGRQRSACKDCGGVSICEHDRHRSSCKDCSGSGICEHNRRRSQCKDCGGCSICEHDKHKFACKDCGGSGTIKIDCPCGSSIRASHIRRHERSAKHKKYVASLEPIAPPPAEELELPHV